MTGDRRAQPAAAVAEASTSADALVRRHFHAQSARPADWRDVPVTSLSPYHRSVLVTDGTVTSTLEAYTLEPVRARCFAQRETTVAAADTGGWLRASPELGVLVRCSELVGARTKTRYARAESLIVPCRLPAAFLSALAAEPAGIGTALRSGRTEVHRELLWFGRPRGVVCARSYRVLIGGWPALMISEWFLC
ncbi:MAG: chorismate--pyruvate lyase family protein [Pseudonocardiaceae bacterium]